MDALAQYKKIADAELKKLNREIKTLKEQNETVRYFYRQLREQKKPSDAEVVHEFVDRFCSWFKSYKDDNDEWNWYDPRKDCKALTVQEYGGFEVMYSLGKENEYDTAIASWWRRIDGRPNMANLDLSSVVEAILTHYQMKHYDPITRREL